MYNPAIFVPQIINQHLTSIYANFMAMSQKTVQNSVYQNSIDFSSIISYAVSMDFKNFQNQYVLEQMKKQLFPEQFSPKQLPSADCNEVLEKKQGKIQKNFKVKSHKIEKQETIELTDEQQKTQKEQPKSKILTLDQSSGKIQSNDWIKENKNSDKKIKKVVKSERLKELPELDLIDFAFIRKDPFSRSELEKRKTSLITRQVQNWNEVQKSRRNEKLQLRRIKY